LGERLPHGHRNFHRASIAHAHSWDNGTRASRRVRLSLRGIPLFGFNMVAGGLQRASTPPGSSRNPFWDVRRVQRHIRAAYLRMASRRVSRFGKRPDWDAYQVHAQTTEVGMNTSAYSVDEWCRHRKICVATFYNRVKHGEMPKTIKIGRRTIITAEADEERRRQRESLADAS
jgi:hypothetical protein